MFANNSSFSVTFLFYSQNLEVHMTFNSKIQNFKVPQYEEIINQLKNLEDPKSKINFLNKKIAKIRRDFHAHILNRPQDIYELTPQVLLTIEKFENKLGNYMFKISSNFEAPTYEEIINKYKDVNVADKIALISEESAKLQRDMRSHILEFPQQTYELSSRISITVIKIENYLNNLRNEERT